jgi:hypothetical protein
MDPTKDRNLSLGSDGGDRLIGDEHALLDQFVGIESFLRLDPDHLTLVIQNQLHLGQIEIDTARSHPTPPQFRTNS